MATRQFEAQVESGERGRIYISLPFDPTEAWGKSRRHYVIGTINDHPFQGSLGVRQGNHFMPLNEELRRAASIKPGDMVKVTMELDQPQQKGMPSDFAEALGNAPEAQAFFDTLSAFYRNQYIEWITSAKKIETRQERLAKTVELLKAGKRQR